MFRFGENWRHYLEHLTPERERIAEESLRELVGDLDGKLFLDVGCGSGLFSLCAHRMGARVVSCDVDSDSVAATESLHEAAGNPEDWTVSEGSILDRDFVSDLPQADVVYSWGVLHHTGEMWLAIRNAARLVAPDGLFCIAIYNRVMGKFPADSERWLRIKRRYNRSSRPVQKLMEWAYAAYWHLSMLRGRKNPLKVAREYERDRGMALKTNLIDWLGGYPYEFATVDEVTQFCEGLGLRRLLAIPDPGTGNNQFVFRR